MKKRNPRVRSISIESAMQMWKSLHSAVDTTLLVRLDEGDYYGHMNRAAYQQLIRSDAMH